MMIGEDALMGCQTITKVKSRVLYLLFDEVYNFCLVLTKLCFNVKSEKQNFNGIYAASITPCVDTRSLSFYPSQRKPSSIGMSCVLSKVDTEMRLFFWVVHSQY